MPRNHAQPPVPPVRGVPCRTRNLGFGVGSLGLAILAAVTASWVPLVVLVALGTVFVGRGLTMPSRD